MGHAGILLRKKSINSTHPHRQGPILWQYAPPPGHAQQEYTRLKILLVCTHSPAPGSPPGVKVRSWSTQWTYKCSRGRVRPADRPTGIVAAKYDTRRGGGGGTQVQRGVALRYIFRGRRGLFLRPPHVRNFVKEGYFFVLRYEVWGSKSPYNPGNIRGSDAE